MTLKPPFSDCRGRSGTGFSTLNSMAKASSFVAQQRGVFDHRRLDLKTLRYTRLPKFREKTVARRRTVMAALPPSLYTLVPLGVMTDSYKATHFAQYPSAEKMVAYGEFRCGFEKDETDTRIVAYGLRYVIENFVARKWSVEDLERACAFYSTHMAPAFTEYPFPKELFKKFIEENDGYFPVTVEAVKEGTCIYPHVPIYQITAEKEYAHLCTFLETVLTMVWYPSSVATLSRRTRDVIESAFEKSVEGGAQSVLVPSRLHDFGFRGCTCPEQSVIGGCAHLLNFTGTDTMSAAYYAQFYLNNGKPVGNSIPASEHSVMTAWQTEREAIENIIGHYGTGIFACVMDSYDYEKALSEVLPSVAHKKTEKGGFMVLRPDSGDPVEAVLMALRAAEKVFGSTENSKGFKVLNNCGVIQGDGINIHVVEKILESAMQAGFSAQNCAFGMGGGLLQRVNRDTMSFATKLNHVTFTTGQTRDLMKTPQTDSGKFSLPGILAVKNVGGIPTVFPKEDGYVAASENLLEVVYDKGPVENMKWDDFETVQKRVAEQWNSLPPTADVLSDHLNRKIEDTMQRQANSNKSSISVGV